MVGDDPVARLTDLKTGKPVAALKGHLDYSFAAAWHPDGHLLATGNQVSACRDSSLTQPTCFLHCILVCSTTLLFNKASDSVGLVHVHEQRCMYICC